MTPDDVSKIIDNIVIDFYCELTLPNGIITKFVFYQSDDPKIKAKQGKLLARFCRNHRMELKRIEKKAWDNLLPSQRKWSNARKRLKVI